MPTKNLIIKGKVQGVFYRATAKREAEKIGVKGWIKNSKEGNVEAAVSGSEEQLKKFIHWCKQGPENAEVKEVAVKEKKETAFDRFVIIR